MADQNKTDADSAKASGYYAQFQIDRSKREATELQKRKRFQKGRKKTGGRAKGTQNKYTIDVAKVLNAVHEKIGGTEAMAKYAQDDPAGFYKLYTKLLPQQVTTELTILASATIERIQAGRDRVAKVKVEAKRIAKPKP